MPKLNACVTLGSVLALVLAAEGVQFCDDLKAMENLDLTKLKGPWWEWAGSGTIKFLLPHTCHVSNFLPSADGKSITSLNDYETVTKDFKEERVKYSWTINDKSPGNDGGLELQIETRDNRVTSVPFLILDTDYEKYLLVYMCKDGPHVLNKFRSALLLTRKPSWKDADLREIDENVNAALAKNGKTRESMGLVHTSILVRDCENKEIRDTLSSNPDANAPTSITATPTGSATAPTSIVATPTDSTAETTGSADAPNSIAVTPTGSAATPSTISSTPTGFTSITTDSAATPTSTTTTTTSFAAAPASIAATPTGSAATAPIISNTPTGFTATTTGSGNTPTSITTTTTSFAAAPASIAATPTGSATTAPTISNTPTDYAATPTATDSTVPTGNTATPTGYIQTLPAGFGRVPARIGPNTRLGRKPVQLASRKHVFSLNNINYVNP